MSSPNLSRDETAALRSRHYNATVVSRRDCHPDLMVIRVQLDQGAPSWEPGQYTVLGLGYWEPRVADCQPESLTTAQQTQLVKRAYSISSPIVDLDESVLEFYIALVRNADHPPALTPRLFHLTPGDRLFCGRHPHGRYTLAAVGSGDDILFAATGTGEAPHNAMLSRLLHPESEHTGQIANVVCVRRRADLGYLETHRELEQRHQNYQFVALTTREPENLDRAHPDYVGKRYLQQYVAAGDLLRETSLDVSQPNVHAFLCGSPDMIGAGDRDSPPDENGMIATLLRHGMVIDHPHHPGNIHFERYWS